MVRKRIILLTSLIVAFISLALLTFGTGHSCKFEAAVLEIIPSAARNVYSSTRGGKFFDPLVTEQIAVDVNAWGLEGRGNTLKGHIDFVIDERGVIKLVANLNMTSRGFDPWDVIAYPEIVYGIKPWNPELKYVKEEFLKLPLSLKELPQIYALVDYAIINVSTAINLAFDLWILRTHEPRNPAREDVELMIWLYREGARKDVRPAGKHIKTVKIPLISEGALSEAEFEIWVEKGLGGGWTYIAYALKDSEERRELVLNVSFFVVEAMRILGLNLEDYYLSSLELGFEIFYNEAIDIVASIYRYYLVVSDKSMNLEQLLLTTGRATRLIAWIVPWGYNVYVEEFNEKFAPGIILAYDVDCGLCTRTLRAWANTSFKLIEDFLHRGKIVYVNLFCEKYYPSWKWRGELTKVTHDEEVLRELKRIVGDGEYVYIGFSEMTACINDQECFKVLVRTYEKLRELFPAARLYYYGSSGDDIESLLKLYKEAGLNIIGLDLWSYKYVEGKVKIDSYLVEKIRQLLGVVPRNAFFVGEIGLRLNDVEAYVEPFNKHRSIIREEGIHRAYYKQVLQHIHELGFKNGYLGIWSWNDEVYAIMIDESLQVLMIDEAVKLNVLPWTCMELETRSGIYALVDRRRVLTATLILMLVITLALLVTVFFIKKRKFSPAVLAET